MSTKIWLDEWVARKRREIAAEEPLSIQTNITLFPYTTLFRSRKSVV